MREVQNDLIGLVAFQKIMPIRINLEIPDQILIFSFDSLLSHKRLLIAEEYGEISWEPYKREDLDSHDQMRNEQELILRQHQMLRLNNPELDFLFALKQHHKELREKRFA